MSMNSTAQDSALRPFTNDELQRELLIRAMVRRNDEISRLRCVIANMERKQVAAQLELIGTTGRIELDRQSRAALDATLQAITRIYAP